MNQSSDMLSKVKKAAKLSLLLLGEKVDDVKITTVADIFYRNISDADMDTILSHYLDTTFLYSNQILCPKCKTEFTVFCPKCKYAVPILSRIDMSRINEVAKLLDKNTNTGEVVPPEKNNAARLG
jgi:hypothetical protein